MILGILKNKIVLVSLILLIIFYFGFIRTASIIDSMNVNSLKTTEIGLTNKGIKYEISWSGSLGEIRNKWNPGEEMKIDQVGAIRNVDYERFIPCVADSTARDLQFGTYFKTYEGKLSKGQITLHYFRESIWQQETFPIDVNQQGECVNWGGAPGSGPCNYEAEIWCKNIIITEKVYCPTTNSQGIDISDAGYCTAEAPTAAYLRFEILKKGFEPDIILEPIKEPDKITEEPAPEVKLPFIENLIDIFTPDEPKIIPETTQQPKAEIKKITFLDRLNNWLNNLFIEIEGWFK